jgi:hypothetical protein
VQFDRMGEGLTEIFGDGILKNDMASQVIGRGVD